jgi:PAS domain S-box-containing protein
MEHDKLRQGETKTTEQLLKELVSLRRRIAELEQNQSEHKKAGDEGRSLEIQLKDILDNAPVGVYRTTPDGCILMANPALVQMLGYSSFEELAQRNLEKEGFEPQYARSMFKERIEKDGRIVGLESAWTRQDGTSAFIIETAWVVRDKHGRPLYYEGIVQDITERKRAEEKVKIFSDAVASAFDCLMLTDIKGNFTYANEAACTTFGYAPEEFLKIDITKLDVDPEVAKKIAQEVATKGKWSGEVINIRKNGEKFHSLLSAFIIRDDQGIPKGTMGILRDVTERKKAEEVLLESQERYRALVDNTILGVTVIDTNYKIIMANTMLAKLFNKPASDFVGKNCFREYEKREAVCPHCPGVRAMASGVTTEVETQGVRDDGSHFYVRNRAIPFFGPDGVVKGFIEITEDISNRKKMEEELREKEKKWTSLTENTNDVIMIVDNKGELQYINKTIPPYTPKATVGKSAYEYVPKEQHDIMRNSLTNVFKTGKPETYEVSSVIPKLGTLWFSTKVVPIKIEENVVNAILISTDITERKKVEVGLKQYQLMVESAQDAILSKDLKSRYIAVNKKALEGFGLPREQVIGKNDYELLPNRDEAGKNIEGDFIVFRTGKPLEAVRQITLADGKEHWFHTLKVPQFDTEGKIVGLVGIGRDITEHKKAEDEVKTIKQQMEFILGATKTGMDIIDSQFNIRFIDHEWQKIYGDPTGKKCYEYFMDRKQVCPDCGIVNALQTKKVAITEEMLVKENNRPIQVTTIPFQDKKGEWLVAEVNVDITERKKAEEACRLSEEKFAKAFNSSPAAIFITTLKEGRFIDLNESAMRVFGYTREDVVGHTAKELNMWANYNDRDIVVQSIRRGNAVRDMDARFRRKSGEVFDGIISVDIINIGGTECLISTTVDITERKKAEDALQKSEESRRAILDATTESVLLIDKQGTILALNRTTARRFGKSVEELVGFKLQDVAPDLASSAVIKSRNEYIDKVVRSGEPVRFEDERGGIIFDSNMFPVFDEKGEVVRLAVFARDITEQRRAEQAMREAKLRYQTLFENAPVGIGVSTKEGKVLECNDAMLEMMGYSEAEIKQINLRDTYQDTQQRQKMLKLLERDGFVRDFEVQLKRKDSTLYWVSLTITPFTLGGHEVLLTVKRDITEQKKAEEELGTYREKMTHAEQLVSVGAISASLAHELTQPLTVARLSIESVLAKPETRHIPGAVEKKLRNCLSGVSDACSVIARFRDYARGMSRTVVTKMNFKIIAERIVKLLEGNSTRAKVNVLVKGLDRLPPVHLSERDIEFFFFALIDNAIQAADGKEEHHLTISGAKKGRQIKLRFADDCGGIAPENLDKIFELFFTTKPIGKGTGLGLCIVKQIASRVGGEVHVESEMGKGSTFFVTLPIKIGGKL